MQQTTLASKIYLINPKGLILVMRRSKSDPRRPLTWDLPGGMVEYGEDPTDAVVRETEEEAGIKIANPQLISVKTTTKGKYTIRLLYYEFINNEGVSLSSEHDQFKWVTRDDFIKLDIPHHYKDPVKDLPEK